MNTHQKVTSFADGVRDMMMDLRPSDRGEFLGQCAAVLMRLLAEENARSRARRGSNVIPFQVIARPIPEARK